MDKSRFEEVRRLRDEYEAALDEAEERRAAYHRAIQRLHVSGMPLREIAEGLGISHQRVHQIVGGESPKKRSRAARGALAASVVLVVGLAGFSTGRLAGGDRRVEATASPGPAERSGDVLDCEPGMVALAFGIVRLPSPPARGSAFTPLTVAALAYSRSALPPGSIVVLDPATGRVVAMAGGRDRVVTVWCAVPPAPTRVRLEDLLQSPTVPRP